MFSMSQSSRWTSIGIYPKKRPKYDAAFVMLEGEAYPDKVPSWGIRAVISEDALSVE